MMKKTLLRIVVAALLLAACGSTPVLADGTPLPMCYPQRCPNN
ncbi:MAG TPA: hypothetical protein VG488_08410 [Candidatus Angelobacter sp.]|nr:hypothetical protein [Candidatus Angelobacter sp.]